jgi:sulfur carrier protein ThiS
MRLIIPDRDTLDLSTEPVAIKDILMEYCINPLEVIVTRNGRLVPEDTIVSGSDEIRIFRVSHGG